jgi:hypothetical protein
MELPPGPVYLLRLLPFFILPSATVYALLRLSEFSFAVALPTWFKAVAVVLAKPALFMCNRYYQKIKNTWDASNNEAILPPYVQESMLSMISKLTSSIRTGYPGQ